MQRLHGLRNGAVQTGTQTSGESFPAGAYSYGLNIFLEGTNGFVSINSKRIERKFRLTSIASAFLISVGDWSLILGTEEFDWCGGFTRAETILGNGALPHFLVGEGMIIAKGDSIVVQARNDSSSTKRIALIFQGEHI
jgi:hypothetical protein